MDRQPTLFSMLLLSLFVATNVSADEMLESARRAFIASNEHLQSAQGSGSFTVHRRNLTDHEEALWIAGSFDLSYDRDKYYLDIKFRKKHSPGSIEDTEGQKIETGTVNRVPDRVSIVCDGREAFVVTFSAMINPTGCSVERFSSMDAAVVSAGFPIRSPAKPSMKVLNVSELIENIGKDEITFSRLGSGIGQGTYKVKNSKSTYVEFDIDPKSGNNVIAKRSFNRPSTEPVSISKLTWELRNSVWCVIRLEDSHKRGLGGVSSFNERTVVTFESFAPNKPIDQGVFTVESLPIPKGTRTLDRRSPLPTSVY